MSGQDDERRIARQSGVQLLHPFVKFGQSVLDDFRLSGTLVALLGGRRPVVRGIRQGLCLRSSVPCKANQYDSAREVAMGSHP